MTIVTLAVAIGANTAMFGVLHNVLLRALPYPEPSRLAEIGRRGAATSGSTVEAVPYPVYERLREQSSRSFSALGVYFQNTGVSRVTLTPPGKEPEGAKAGFVSASFFEVMGVVPRLGRVFTRGEEQSREPVAVLSDALWRRRFGESGESIEGALIQINGVSFQVIGVMPASFAWPSRDSAIWIPVTHNREWARRAGPVPFFRVAGRLAAGVTRKAAMEELQALYSSNQNGMMSTAAAPAIAVVPLRPPLAGDHERAIYMLAAAVGCVLLIACANIASLTLARGSKRANEVALRMALGGGRLRVAGELFLESLLLAAAGAAGGVLLGSFAIDALLWLRPANFEQMNEVRISGGVLAFTALCSLGCAVLFGLAPAWQIASRDPMKALRGLGRGTSDGAQGVRLRRLLVAGELALTVVLLAGSGVMLRSLAAAQRVDLGFDPAGALTFRVLFPDGIPAERRVDYFGRLFDRLGSVPGVKAAGAVGDLFELSAPGTQGLRAVEGRAPEPAEAWTPLTWTTVGGNYFEAMGARLASGRWFSEGDGFGSSPVALIDEGAARRYWPGENPVGRRFKGWDARGAGDEWVTVIGVVKDMRRQGVDRQPTAHVYEWYRQSFNLPRDVVVRAAAPVGREIRGLARSLDSTVILSDVKPVEGEIDDQLSLRRFQSALLSAFAGIAFVLAGVGIYGVVSYSVSVRAREFGIRAALGESSGGLRSRVMREALALALAGIGPGLAGAWAASRLVRSQVFGVSAMDPASLAGACVLLGLTAISAAALPAIRASRVDPAAVLRQD